MKSTNKYISMKGAKYIDNVKLLMEIKKHPCLYDSSDKEYKNTSSRNEAWKKVSEDVVGTNRWIRMSPEKKFQVEKETYQRWRCLKEAFRRSLKKQSMCIRKGLRKPQPYALQKHMAFLIPSLKLQLSEEELAKLPRPPSELSEDEDDPDQDQGMDQKPQLSSFLSVSSRQSQRHEVQPPIQDSQDVQEIIRIEGPRPQRNNSDKSSTRDPNVKYRLLKKLEKSLSHMDEDPDRMFLLSLASHLKQVRPRDQLRARMKIMEILDSFIQSSDNSTGA